MNEYKINALEQYIKESKIITITDYFKIRLSNELYIKYSNHLYDDGLNCFLDYINEIRSLNFKYPGNANPIFFMYIVPNDNFKELLGFAKNFNYSGGGRPVESYDLDGFPTAYGVSSNIVEGRKNPNIIRNTNSIHEFAHLVQSFFFQNKGRFWAEGMAEAITFYTLDYENKLIEHRKCLKELTEEQILSAKDLIKIDNNFDTEPIIPDTSCSFSITYISAYLFIRGLIQIIEEKFKLNRIEATQKLLEIIRVSPCSHEWGVFDVATSIGINKEELLYSKKMQMNIIKNI